MSWRQVLTLGWVALALWSCDPTPRCEPDAAGGWWLFLTPCEPAERDPEPGCYLECDPAQPTCAPGESCALRVVQGEHGSCHGWWICVSPGG